MQSFSPTSTNFFLYYYTLCFIIYAYWNQMYLCRCPILCTIILFFYFSLFLTSWVRPHAKTCMPLFLFYLYLSKCRWTYVSKYLSALIIVLLLLFLKHFTPFHQCVYLLLAITVCHYFATPNRHRKQRKFSKWHET